MNYNYLIILFVFLGATQVRAADIDKWKQFRISYNNTTWSGNPFDLEFTVNFTSPTGKSLKQFGFYAGNNTWKIYFMPNEIGSWTFITNSTDQDLNNKSGSFNCVSSNLPGPLKANGKRWQFSDSKEFIAPLMIPTRDIRSKPISTMQPFFDWADQIVGADIIGTTMVYFGHGQSLGVYVEGQSGKEFHLPVWNRLNDNYDYIRDKGMGHYIMFYSDDNESPNLHGIPEGANGTISQEEVRLFKYAVARLGAYPTVIWDTGIDISETRSEDWVDNFAVWFNENDPWKHPVSSRNGGGSFGKNPDQASYYSDGENYLPTRNKLVENFNSRNIPTLYTDRWREDYYLGGFDRNKIRRAMWEGILAGGSGMYLSGNENGGYLYVSVKNYEPYLSLNYDIDFKAAPDLGKASKFVKNNIKNFGQLVPSDELILSGNAIAAAAPGKEYVLYLNTGGSVKLSISGSGHQSRWYNPRTGLYQNANGISGSFTAPDSMDWVLHIFKNDDGSSGDNSAPQSPKLLEVK